MSSIIVIFIAVALLAWRFALLTGALRRARLGEAQLRLLAECGGEIGWIVAAESGQLLFISPAAAKLFGYAGAQQAALLQALAATLAGDLPQRMAALAGGDETQRQLNRELEQAHADGHAIPLEVTSTLVHDPRGTLLLVGTLRDVSALREQQKAQKKFASMISHEFRTPLATIDGAIQRLEMTADNVDDATRKRYRKIQTAVDRLLGMINEYLSPERMASIGRARQPNEVAPQQLLDTAANAANLAPRPVSIQVSGLPAYIRCDPEGMRLTLQILLENANKYSPPGTPIELVGRAAAEGGIEFLVIDHGPGLHEDEMGRVFEKFFRGRDVAALAGSGLGLYMARAVLEVHGGTVTVQNAAAGGAVFRIWLPITADSGKTLASSESNSDNSSTQDAFGDAHQ